MALARATLTTSASTVYTSTNNSAITAIYLCNYSGSDVTVTMHLVPTAGSADNTNIIYKAISIPSSDTYVIDSERMLLSNGDMLQALCSANTSLTVTVSYIGV